MELLVGDVSVILLGRDRSDVSVQGFLADGLGKTSDRSRWPIKRVPLGVDGHPRAGGLRYVKDCRLGMIKRRGRWSYFNYIGKD